MPGPDLASLSDFCSQRRQQNLWPAVPVADRCITELDEVAKSQIWPNVEERVDWGQQWEFIPIDLGEILPSAQRDPALIDAEVSVR